MVNIIPHCFDYRAATVDYLRVQILLFREQGRSDEKNSARPSPPTSMVRGSYNRDLQTLVRVRLDLEHGIFQLESLSIDVFETRTATGM